MIIHESNKLGSMPKFNALLWWLEPVHGSNWSELVGRYKKEEHIPLDWMLNTLFWCRSHCIIPSFNTDIQTYLMTEALTASHIQKTKLKTQSY